MKVTLKKDKLTAIIDVPHATLFEAELVIDAVFKFFANGGDVATATPPENAKRTDPDYAKDMERELSTGSRPHVTEADRENVRKLIPEARKQAEQTRPRVLPKIDATEPTLLQNIGEKFGDKLRQALQPEPALQPEQNGDEPEHWQTGVQYKEINGEQVPTYRTYYYCPHGHKGRRYIPKSNTFVHCHTCNTKIGVRLAHEDGFPNRDEWGNFFIADQEVAQ